MTRHVSTNREAREGGQLSLTVTPHPNLSEDDIIVGTLAISGELHCPTDVQSGDDLTVQVANSDGVVIATGQLKGRYPKMKELKDKGVVIGTQRGNKAEVYDT